MLYLPVGIGQTAEETERVVAAVAGALRLWQVSTMGAGGTAEPE